MYADFTDYQGAYCGTLITTQGQWMPAVREACAYLDSITFGRLSSGCPPCGKPALIWTASPLAA